MNLSDLLGQKGPQGVCTVMILSFRQTHLGKQSDQSLHCLPFCNIYCKICKTLDTGKSCCNHPKIRTKWLYHGVMHPKDADRIANNVDPDQTRSSLIWVYTVCPELSVFSAYFFQVPELFGKFYVGKILTFDLSLYCFT